MATKDQLIASAQKNLEKGQINKAIKDYQELLKLEPNGDQHKQKLADLYCRVNLKVDALSLYDSLAKKYAERGFFTKAIAVYKQMQRIDSANPDTYQRLAELNRNLGLIGNAISEYRSLLEIYENRNLVADAAGVLQRMVELEPENINLQLRVLQYLLKEKLYEKAKETILKACEVCGKSGDSGKSQKILQTILSHLPENIEFHAELADKLGAGGLIPDAIFVFTSLLKRSPRDQKILSELAMLYGKIDDAENEISILEQLLAVHPTIEAAERLVRLCIATGDHTRALRTLDEHESLLDDESHTLLIELYQQLEIKLPGDQRVRRAIVRFFGGPTPPPVTDEASPPLVELSLGDTSGDFSFGDDEFQLHELLSPHPRSSETTAQSQQEIPCEEEDSEEIDISIDLPEEEISLDDVDTFKEIEELNLSRETLQADMDLSLIDIDYDFNENEEIRAEEIRAEEIRAEEIRAAEIRAAEIRAEEIRAEEIRAEEIRAEEIRAEEIRAEEIRAEEIRAEEIRAEEIRAEEIRAEEIRAEEIRAAEIRAVAESEIDRAVSEELEGEFVADEDLIDLSSLDKIADTLDIDLLPREELSLEESIESLSDVIDAGAEDDDEILELEPLEEEEDLDAELADLEALLDAEMEAPPAEQSFELNFSVDQAVSGSTDHAVEDDFFDLAAEILDEGAMQATEGLANVGEIDRFRFDSVFAEFKKGVDAQIDHEDTEAHYDLGIAYKEMGLMDDAIEEFKKSMLNPKRLADSLILIGICYAEKGAFAEAESVFSAAIARPEVDETDKVGTQYELGLVYEVWGRPVDALRTFEAVAHSDPTFRNVGEKIEALRLLVAAGQGETTGDTPGSVSPGRNRVSFV